MKLGELFNKYGTDKDINGYTPYYDAIFKNIRYNPIDFLELGIGTLFILANQFTIFAETGLHLQLKDVFTGTYTSDVYKMKYGISIGVNYHF